uniref:Uncharacterized protein n=1 Tax=Anguilla anguilla TaxID=7936 RepID=A0A0E9QW87_ANGAN
MSETLFCHFVSRQHQQGNALSQSLICSLNSKNAITDGQAQSDKNFYTRNWRTIVSIAPLANGCTLSSIRKRCRNKTCTRGEAAVLI